MKLFSKSTKSANEFRNALQQNDNRIIKK